MYARFVSKPDDDALSTATSVAPSEGGAELFGNRSGTKTKGKPVRGYKFMIFTVVMIILLSSMVIWSQPDLQEVSKERINNDSDPQVPQKNETAESDK